MSKNHKLTTFTQICKKKKKFKYVTQNDDTNDDTKKSKLKKTDETYFTTKIEELVQRKKIVYEREKKIQYARGQNRA